MKRIFTIFGAISMMGIIALMSGVVVLASKALGTADDNKQAAVAAVRQISKNWSVEGHSRIVAPSLVSIAQSPRGARAFRIFGRLGRMIDATTVEQTNFSMSTDTGTMATISFDGTFTNGRAKVIVRLRQINGVMKVIGLQTKDTVLIKQAPMSTA
jgi:hypothetical protein